MITLLCFGTIKEKALISLISEFEKRLTRFLPYQITRKSFSLGNQKESEEKILTYMKKYPNKRYLLLDEAGKQQSSQEFSTFLQKELVENEIVFVLGDSFGFSSEFKKQFSHTLSFSKMTFTHEMVELLFYEQVYRSAMISSGKSYHK
jgi:23S rRNA (pseudouridine1915-N3)-methyltransferase